MQQVQLFQIDAFTDEVFHGNPAAVCPLEQWLDSTTLQATAQENNLAETAFFVPRDDGFHIRWFTPTQEVLLCGHATLASAFVIFTELDPEYQVVRFESKSGPLVASHAPGFITHDGFPDLSHDALSESAGWRIARLEQTTTGGTFYRTRPECSRPTSSVRGGCHGTRKPVRLCFQIFCPKLRDS